MYAHMSIFNFSCILKNPNEYTLIICIDKEISINVIYRQWYNHNYNNKLAKNINKFNLNLHIFYILYVDYVLGS